MADDEYEGLTPEERASQEEYDREEAEMQQEIRELIDAGYTRDSVKWVSPSDPEIWYAFDPLTHDRIYSPKRSEQIEADLERRKAAGEL